jgi:ABC-2 type transport system ATP-binding protein
VLDGAVSTVKAAHGSRVIALAVGGEARAMIGQVLADRTLVARVDDQNRFYEINLAPGADPQQLLRRVLETGAPIQRFELVQPSLHQIFLEKVGATGVEEGMSGQG